MVQPARCRVVGEVKEAFFCSSSGMTSSPGEARSLGMLLNYMHCAFFAYLFVGGYFDNGSGRNRIVRMVSWGRWISN